MTDRELLKEARDLIVMCSLLDKSGQCNDMVNRIDEQLSIPCVVGRSEQLFCDCSQGKGADIDEDGFPYCIDCQKNIAK